MAEHEGSHKVKLLQQRWVSYQVGADLLLSAAAAILSGSLLHFVFGASFIWAIALFVLVFALVSLIRRPWQVTVETISRYLNQTYPQLEESCDLVLQPSDRLNLLESIQRAKVEDALQTIPDSPQQFSKRLKQGAIFLIVALLLSFAIAKIHVKWGSALSKFSTVAAASANKSLKPEKILPQISSVEVKINPPAYTNREQRSQDKFTLDVEEGSVVNWAIKTNINVKQVSLIFNEHETIKMQSSGDLSHWSSQKGIKSAGFYQVSIDGKLSDLYPIQVIKDVPPVIRIKTPKQYTHIDAGEKPQVNINASLTDDYGISSAVIAATVAKGSGEAVKFKEYKINFAESFAGHSKQYNLQKMIDLPALNMEPGDELYFYIQAQDTHQQISKTDVYIVSIQDTAALLSMDGIMSGVNMKPEFFRSERQIIIDSQRLLHDRDSISKDEFNKRSNELGTDQKLLRLRYGKFLGEEDESKIGEDDNPELGKAENFGNSKMIMDAYTDKHDNAEDATFLEPTAKAQLKATLTEMWKAELHLRMYKPDEALPFEFKALRLLKDLQQKSRSYVAKTGYNPPQLKLEKRLSGDLTKVADPVTHTDIKKQGDQFETLKRAVMVLEQLKLNPQLNSNDQHVLQLAGQQLSSRAAAQPGVYLTAVSALRNLTTSKNASRNNINIIEKAIQRALPANKAMPQSANSADVGLADGYFKNLNRLNR